MRDLATDRLSLLARFSHPALAHVVALLPRRLYVRVCLSHPGCMPTHWLLPCLYVYVLGEGYTCPTCATS